jgi:hypothetical protein
VEFASNFTKSLSILNNADLSPDFSDSGFIQVHLDQTNLQITSFLQHELYEAYRKFIESLMEDCGKAKKAGSSPITFEAAFGQLGFKMKTSIVSGILLA